MTQPDEFDQFYRDVRTRLLLLTYCLTGDLPSSRAAVRDAFVVAWHHWRKVTRVEDPEAWVREHACRHAVRRHTAKIWHREKGLDPEVKATLDALGRLSITQRRVLLVTELTSSSLDAMAREVGLPRTEAERELQTATATFALHREIPTTDVRRALEAVRGHVESYRWPRATILRRAGATRRRTHTVIGVAATAAALVITGALVTDADGVRPTLAGERIEAEQPDAPKAPKVVELPEDSLLAADSVAQLAPGNAGWVVARTDDNSAGAGLAMACQTSRYAAPDGRPDNALVRVFDPARTATKSAGGPSPTVVQAAEAAPSAGAAHRAYATALRWFAGCRDDRTQLLGTYDLPGIGDEAMLFALRDWSGGDSDIVAGVARTGSFTTVTVSTDKAATDRARGAEPAAVARLLARGVDQLCELPEGGSCATDATPRATAPVPVAQAPGMLAEIDLPPVAGVRRPWVGTEPRRALANAAATHCDGTDFSSVPMTNNLTRTFLVPESRLPDEFGLTESVGTLPRNRAKAFVAGVRDKMARCAKKQMGTKVTRLRDVSKGPKDLTVWKVSTEVTDERSIDFLMGVVRNGTAVAQVGFVPVKDFTVGGEAFEDLTQRALDRIAAMPRPRAR
jgi:DNA-directed RNA polymerase specialized sigma24 family protein